MKSVLISIRPEWCEKIARGVKTVEVRKTRPKIDTPFKCYIYCTKGNGSKEQTLWLAGSITRKTKPQKLNGRVVGEFVCKKIVTICIEYSDADVDFSKRVYFPCTCLTDKQILDYLGNGNSGYGWCISDLVIYDKPLSLKCFTNNGAGNKWWTPITRPPQSWQYIDEVRGN